LLVFILEKAGADAERQPSPADQIDARRDLAPLARCARANASGLAGGLRRLPAENHFDETLSTERRQAGILVDVHSALPRIS
jgi:hypothetical protein